MRTMVTNPFNVARQFLGIGEIPGAKDNTLVLAMLQQDNSWVEHDEVAWCSAFVSFVCMVLGLRRSRSLAARSWLEYGLPIDIEQAEQGFDIVILKRGTNPALGHVGFFFSRGNGKVKLLGGNQGNRVSIAEFREEDIVGVRRLG